MSPAVAPHMKKVYSIVRQIHGRSPTDDMNDLDVIFVTVTLHAAVHKIFGESTIYQESNQILKSVKELFRVTEKLIKGQREVGGLTTIDDKEPAWRSTTLLCDKAIEITNAKTCVFADSVLCLGSMITRTRSLSCRT